MFSPWVTGAATAGVGTLLGAAGLTMALRRRGLHRWIVPYLLSGRQRRSLPWTAVHLLLAVCDHFEPKRDNASLKKATQRVRQWSKNTETVRQVPGF